MALEHPMTDLVSFDQEIGNQLRSLKNLEAILTPPHVANFIVNNAKKPLDIASFVIITWKLAT